MRCPIVYVKVITIQVIVIKILIRIHTTAINGNINNNHVVKTLIKIKNKIPTKKTITALVLCLISAFSFSNSNFGKNKFNKTPAYEIKIVINDGIISIINKYKNEIFKTKHKTILATNMIGIINKMIILHFLSFH